MLIRASTKKVNHKWNTDALTAIAHTKTRSHSRLDFQYATTATATATASGNNRLKTGPITQPNPGSLHVNPCTR